MGVNLRDIIASESISFAELKGKTIAIDAMSFLYPFLSSIRQPDGTPLMDSHGRTTSHLSGLMYRTSQLIKRGIKPIYVFDGTPPELKFNEIRRRKEKKAEAHEKWETAVKEGDVELALKHAKRTSKFTPEMIDDSKMLLGFMGVPWVQAPSEGEAQCVHMCRKGDAWAVGSQDYDSILLGAPKLIKNLTFSGDKDLEIIHIEKVLKNLNITREQLIDVAILVGTDFNPGVHGVGPKKALKAVSENKISELEMDFDIDAVREIFIHPKTTDEYELKWTPPDKVQLIKFLCMEHDFSRQRVEKAGSEIDENFREFSQRSLSSWF